MHPLSTFEIHRQDQAALLHRSTQRRVPEPTVRHRDDAHGRPPDPHHHPSPARAPERVPAVTTAAPVAR